MSGVAAEPIWMSPGHSGVDRIGLPVAVLIIHGDQDLG